MCASKGRRKAGKTQSLIIDTGFIMGEMMQKINCSLFVKRKSLFKGTQSVPTSPSDH